MARHSAPARVVSSSRQREQSAPRQCQLVGSSRSRCSTASERRCRRLLLFQGLRDGSGTTSSSCRRARRVEEVGILGCSVRRNSLRAHSKNVFKRALCVMRSGALGKFAELLPWFQTIPSIDTFQHETCCSTTIIHQQSKWKSRVWNCCLIYSVKRDGIRQRLGCVDVVSRRRTHRRRARL